MSTYDIKSIMKNVGYGRLNESGNYSVDFKPLSTGVDFHQTNQMGDNPMPDPEKISEEVAPEITDAVMDKMSEILTKVGYQESDIAIGNCRIKAESAPKVARILTGQEVTDPQAFVAAVISALSERMNPSTTQPLEEFADAPQSSRFTFTLDELQNITVSDAETGKSVFLQGQDAVGLLGELVPFLDQDNNVLDAAGVQEVLSQYQHVMESEAEEAPLEEDMGYGRSVSRLMRVVDELSQIAGTATEVPSSSVVDWGKQNEMQIGLEPILAELQKLIQTLNS